ncbi:MAG: RtcB family protein [Candidatus Rokubacteria bacterium]|nr:RtcB family protein [Candidatus Rokubacteria bacterium]
MKVEQVGPYLWRIPPDAKPGMRVPGLIVADEALMAQIRRDASLEQVANAATLPGIVKASLAMPDIHQGYGLPVGGVVATDVRDGVVSPGGVGYDINCGVRLLRTSLTFRDIQARLAPLVDGLYAAIPAGVGSRGRVKLSAADERRAVVKGAGWAVEQGYGILEDLQRIESGGSLAEADAEAVSQKAYERGRGQLGTLGSGNHFLEVQVVEEIYDAGAARVLGLFQGQITVMIHTGSRGFGHQVCTDYLRRLEGAVRKYGIQLPDRQLACAPLDSPEAKDYLGAMRAAANFAFANRQCLAHWTREAFMQVLALSPNELGMVLVYDLAHNIAKTEEHEVDGQRRRVVVHRKGATRAFPPGHPELAETYREIGQPVLIPGDMGRYSFVLVGTASSMRETFGSTCHGAGRVMSRTAAVKAARGRQIARELEAKGILARATGRDALEEEMPEAYKDVKDVVEVVEKFGISKKVAKLRPVGVIKG